MDRRFIKRGPSVTFLVCLLIGIGLGAFALGAGVTALGFLAYALPSADGGRQAGTQPADLAGVWTVTYTNNTVRRYVIGRDGNVSVAGGKAPGRLGKLADGMLVLSFDGDGKLERLTLGADGRLFVEHYDPGTGFPNKRPTHIGIGVRQE